MPFNADLVAKPASGSSGFNPNAVAAPRSSGFNASAVSATPATAPTPAAQPQGKPYQAPGWDVNLHRGLDSIGHAWDTVTRPARTIMGVTNQANPAIQGLPKMHNAGTALEQVGDWLPSTVIPTALGAVASDIADTKGAPGAHAKAWTDRMLHGDAVSATRAYYPTSGEELERLDKTGSPVISQVAHQLRNHPIVTGALTTAAQFAAPNVDAAVGRMVGGGAKALGRPIAAAGGHLGTAIASHPLAQTQVGQAAGRGINAVRQAGANTRETIAKNFGSPAHSLKKALPQNPTAQAAGENQAMRFLNAQRIAMHEANSRTQHAFKPEHQTNITPGLTPQKVGTGSSLDEQKSAVDFYQAREHRLAFDRAPEPVRNAAVKMNEAWEKYKADPANEKQIEAANMGRIPRDPQGKPIWNSMDVRFAPDDFVNREANVSGLPRDQHTDIYDAARSQFLSKYEPDLSKLDPKAAVRVARMSHGIRNVVNETTDRLKATDPKLLPKEKTAYFPARNLLEDTEQEEAHAPQSATRGGSTVRTPYDRSSRYGSVAQMREAGLEPFEGLTPEDALRDDLQRKWTNIHSTNAFNTLGSMRDRWGNDLVSRQEYIDPKTKKQVDYDTARDLAKNDIVKQSLEGAAAHRGDQFNPKTGLPSHFPSRIPNVDIAKSQAIQAHKEMKLGEGLQQQLGEQGTRFVDRAVDAALNQEDAAERLGNSVQGNVDAMKGHQYASAEGQRQSFDRAKDASGEHLESARGRMIEAETHLREQASQNASTVGENVTDELERLKGAGFIRSSEDRAAFESLLKKNEDSSYADKRSIAAAQNAVGRAGEKQQGSLGRGLSRVDNHLAENQQLAENLSMDEANRSQEQLSSSLDRVQDQTRRSVGSQTESAFQSVSKRGNRITRDVDTFQKIQKNLHAYSIDATQAERKKLEGIASKYATAGNDRFRKAVTKYYVSAYDTKYRQQFLNLAKSLRAELSQDGENAVTKRVEDNYRVKDPNYINAQRLKEAGINIPGVGPDQRIAKDAYDFFVENNVPRKESGDFSRFMGNLDNFGRMGVVYNPIIHGVFNLGSTYIGRTRDAAGLAKAMPMLLGTMANNDKAFDAWKASKAQTLALMRAENAYQPGGFSEMLPYFTEKEEERDPTGRITGFKTAGKGSDSYSAMRRSVTRKDALPREQQVRQLMDNMAEWNSRVVFDRFEPWYAVNLFEHETKRLGSIALAARSVRDAMGTDLITPFEKQHITPHFWFYPWFKTITRFAVATGIHDPSWWNAPLQGTRVERENSGAGDIRVGNNPYMWVTPGKGGGLDTHTLPLPQRILNSLATLALGSPDSRDHSIDRFAPAVGTLTGHLAPMESSALDFANEVASHGKTPDYANPVDPDASLPQMAQQASGHVIGKYTSPIEQLQQLGGEVSKDPAGTPGHFLGHALGINNGYRLPGDNVGGGIKGSPYSVINSLRARMAEHAPNGRYPNPGQYASSQAQLKQMYARYPEAAR